MIRDTRDGTPSSKEERRGHVEQKGCIFSKEVLHIENFIETYVAKNPPVFTNIILVRSTSKKPNTGQCNHRCFANGTISDAELTEMIRGPWWTDENSMDFGYIYSDDSLAIYWIGKEDFMAGICKFYHFQVKDGKIWFYTDEEIKEIEEPYGSNINFSTCFSLETIVSISINLLWTAVIFSH